MPKTIPTFMIMSLNIYLFIKHIQLRMELSLFVINNRLYLFSGLVILKNSVVDYSLKNKNGVKSIFRTFLAFGSLLNLARMYTRCPYRF